MDKITQADRLLVADILDEVSTLLDHNGIGQIADLIRDGEYDEHECVQIAVRHRLATLTDATPVATDVAALVEAAKDALPFMTQLRAGICLKTDGKIVSADSAYQNLYAALAPFTKGQNDE